MALWREVGKTRAIYGPYYYRNPCSEANSYKKLMDFLLPKLRVPIYYKGNERL
jgi:hypothetical protein